MDDIDQSIEGQPEWLTPEFKAELWQRVQEVTEELGLSREAGSSILAALYGGVHLLEGQSPMEDQPVDPEVAEQVRKRLAEISEQARQDAGPTLLERRLFHLLFEDEEAGN